MSGKLIKYTDVVPGGPAIFYVGEHKSDPMCPPFYVGSRFEHAKVDFPSLYDAEMIDLVIRVKDFYRDHYDADAKPRIDDVHEVARRLRQADERRYTDDQALDYLAGVTGRDISGRGAVFKRVKTRKAIPGFGWAAEGAEK